MLSDEHQIGSRLHIDRTVLAREAREFTESYIVEDAVLSAARARGIELGLTPIQPGGGAALRILAAATRAKAVVEVGTGSGVSGVWLLRGMRTDGVLTTMDAEAEHQRYARQAFLEAGFTPGRTRLITGRALSVLPRLADAAYDLVFIDGEKIEYPQYLEQAQRLLRPGGAVAIDNALWGGRLFDTSVHDAETMAVRETVKRLRGEEDWIPALLPVGDGLLVAVKR
ncbi:MAG: O-methyltransferase [Longispora sp.]|nr:O-methyltransferase [Longispora sp. (in: high G+C Gram-positive bacteria)]